MVLNPRRAACQPCHSGSDPRACIDGCLSSCGPIPVPANFAAVKGRKDDPIDDAAHGQRLAESVGDYGAALRIAASEPMHF